MPTGSCITVFLRNIIMEREPVHAIAEWTAKFAPSLFGLPPVWLDESMMAGL